MTEVATATSALFDHVASAENAVRHFRGRLAYETDVSDVRAALDSDARGFTLIDTRNDQAWAQGHVPGAVHLPTRRIRDEVADLVPAGTPVVVYCWGPGCNGATRAALELALLGYPVKEMIGGFEYWVREGFAFETADGPVQPAVDATVNVAPAAVPAGQSVGAISCAC
ncbi:rhodanese-like domain-containing protein [Agromyces intestinalis]|uniref:Rhodanese-like domain-containing protein n=1 Tax=Agromyces intestinalis TaxID=2592652 RepID=A0A5C1YHE1_9MICO|nr:rhodanese-like domain-containing protein [Agromyces intestinalis]QEO15373.1 rhodanese-like domain-containing protein [Agromyces intestinalis]